MTIVYFYKEYEINGTTYYIRRYADKPDFVKLWEYGYITKWMSCGKKCEGCLAISRGLLSRPNLKRLFGG